MVPMSRTLKKRVKQQEDDFYIVNCNLDIDHLKKGDHLMGTSTL